MLPLSTSGPITFPALRSQPAFQGLPGVLADSLPDSFGNAVIRSYYAGRGEPEKGLSPVQRLLYVGDRAMGALEFRPAERIPARRGERESLELAQLVREARNIVEGRPETAVPDIYRVGASAGGLRPKAIVLFDQATGRLRSGHAKPRPGEEHWLLKFDGVPPVGLGLPAGEREQPQPYMRVENAYAELARSAGIAMTETRLLEEGAYAHFMIRRFDRSPGGRLHQHTFGGLIHADYNDPGVVSYEEYLRTVLTLTEDYSQLDQAFRRMVFNVVAVNQDDHVKNLSFLMDRSGRWSVSPAYDLTYAAGHGWTREHQMTIRGKRSAFTRADLLDVGEAFGVRRPSKIVDRTLEAVAGWGDAAGRSGVPKAVMERIGSALAGRHAEVA